MVGLNLLQGLVPDVDMESENMNLVKLLGLPTPLLDACVGGDIPTLRALREVSKEASKVVLRAHVRAYTLVFRGEGSDTRPEVGKMLQHMGLRHVTVRLFISGVYNPSVGLMAHLVGFSAALGSVTTLDLQVESATCNSYNNTVLDCAVAALLHACPVLTNFSSTGQLSSLVLSSLAAACPRLSALTISAGSRDITYLQNVALLQRSLLPGIVRLTLRSALHSEYPLPDMSKSSIQELDLQGFSFRCNAEWFCLPRKLQLLICHKIEEGPDIVEGLADDGEHLFPSLRRLEVDSLRDSNEAVAPTEIILPIRAVARILLVAPDLQTLKIGTANNTGMVPRFIINCYISDPKVAAYLTVLLGRTEIDSIRNASYCLDCVRSPEQGYYNTIIAALPRMIGIHRCELSQSVPGELRPLLDMFPDLRELGLTSYDGADLDDYQLLGVAAQCPRLTHLRVTGCNDLTPVGLLLLSQRLPTLGHIVCEDCDQLSTPVLDKSMQLLRGYGFSVDMVDSTYMGDFEE